MSAWWILPALVLVAGAALLWWAARGIAVEAAKLRSELGNWDRTKRELAALQADARHVGARYRQVRRR